MAAVALAFFAGILTVAAPCSLPVLPALLGVSLGQRDKARPAFITMGFVVSFTAAAIFFSVTTQIAGGLRRRRRRSIGRPAYVGLPIATTGAALLCAGGAADSGPCTVQIAQLEPPALRH
jgi:cytochrome c biogenesis protein CcdA